MVTNIVETDLLAELKLIEDDLKSLMLWSGSPPVESAFLSQQPFFLDTMSFHDWLQFVFISRVRLLIENKQALPVCGISPMAKYAFGADTVNRNGCVIKNQNEKILTLITRLEKIDHLLSPA